MLYPKNYILRTSRQFHSEKNYICFIKVNTCKNIIHSSKRYSVQIDCGYYCTCANLVNVSFTCKLSSQSTNPENTFCNAQFLTYPCPVATTVTVLLLTPITHVAHTTPKWPTLHVTTLQHKSLSCIIFRNTTLKVTINIMYYKNKQRLKEY
jgi:hypothetical protein